MERVIWNSMKFSDLEPSTRIILKVMLVLLGLAFLWLIRDILIIVLLAVVLASALEPLVEYLNQHKIPRAVSVLAVYIIFIGLAAVVVSLLVPVMIDQFKSLEQNLPSLVSAF